MIQDKSLQELLADLRISSADLDQITTSVMKKIQTRSGQSKQLGLSELANAVAQEILRQTQKTSSAQTANNPSMSKTISVKASVHYYRWKFAFQFPPHTGINVIKKYLDYHHIDHEDFFIEIASLFIVTSTAGVHLRLVPNFGVERIKRSLNTYSLDQPITVRTVEALYYSLPHVHQDG